MLGLDLPIPMWDDDFLLQSDPPTGKQMATVWYLCKVLECDEPPLDNMSSVIAWISEAYEIVHERQMSELAKAMEEQSYEYLHNQVVQG